MANGFKTARKRDILFVFGVFNFGEPIQYLLIIIIFIAKLLLMVNYTNILILFNDLLKLSMLHSWLNENDLLILGVFYHSRKIRSVDSESFLSENLVNLID